MSGKNHGVRFDRPNPQLDVGSHFSGQMSSGSPTLTIPEPWPRCLAPDLHALLRLGFICFDVVLRWGGSNSL